MYELNLTPLVSALSNSNRENNYAVKPKKAGKKAITQHAT